MLRVVLVQSWTSDMTSISGALARAGFSAEWMRADFPAAIEAALADRPCDVVIATPDLDDTTRAWLDERRARGDMQPLVELGELETLGARIRTALAKPR